MLIELPVQMLVIEIVAAAGNGLTVMVKEFDLTQPFEFVSATVYVVLDVGETEGFEEVEVNPEGLLIHE